jgi:hypothetical protein
LDNIFANNMDDTIRLFAKYFSSVYTSDTTNTNNIIDDFNNDLFHNQFHNFNLNSFIIYEHEIIDFIVYLMTRQVLDPMEFLQFFENVLSNSC